MLNLNSVMIGTKQPLVLAAFYEKVFGKPADMVDDENGFWGWQLGTGFFGILNHSEVGGKTKDRLDMKPSFFSRLLDIKLGDPYDHSKVVKSKSRIRDLQFVQQREEPFVRFINDKAILVLTPDPKPASRFDFLIGVLPEVTNGVRKWNLSVDFTAEMNNSFRGGEYSFIQVKRLKPENLELQLKSTIPYIFDLPIGTHADFRLFKNGSKNLDVYFDGGFQYMFGGFNQIRLFGSYRSSRLIEIDANQIALAGRLPSSLDISYKGAGINLNIRQLD